MISHLVYVLKFTPKLACERIPKNEKRDIPQLDYII